MGGAAPLELSGVPLSGQCPIVNLTIDATLVSKQKGGCAFVFIYERVPTMMKALVSSGLTLTIFINLTCK